MLSTPRQCIVIVVAIAFSFLGKLKVPILVKNQLLAQVPNGFPGNAPDPVFQLGDRVRWKPRPNSDVGTVVGLQYVPTKESAWQKWDWKYVVWLDLGSDSRSWTTSDMAWEADLEPLADASQPSLTHQEEV